MMRNLTISKQIIPLTICRSSIASMWKSAQNLWRKPKMMCLIICGLLLTAGQLNAQILYDQPFDTLGQGFNGCVACDTFNSPGYPNYVNSWRLIGNGLDLSDGVGIDYFETVDIGGDTVLEAKGLQGQMCFETTVFDISTQAAVRFSIDVSESGNMEGLDYIDVSFNVDSHGYVKIPNWMGNGSDGSVIRTLNDDWDSDTVQTCVSGSSMSLLICVQNDANTELHRIDRVLVEAEPLGPTTQCTDCAGFCGPCAYPPTDANPDLQACTSLNIAFVIDESGSVADSVDQVADGVLAFLSEIACPNAQVAIIEFNTTAQYVIPDYTPLTPEVLDSMVGYFNGDPYNGQTYDPANLTNWEHAFHLVDSITTPPDLVLFFTDGAPTAWDIDGVGNS